MLNGGEAHQVPPLAEWLLTTDSSGGGGGSVFFGDEAPARLRPLLGCQCSVGWTCTRAHAGGQHYEY